MPGGHPLLSSSNHTSPSHCNPHTPPSFLPPSYRSFPLAESPPEHEPPSSSSRLTSVPCIPSSSSQDPLLFNPLSTQLFMSISPSPPQRLSPFSSTPPPKGLIPPAPSSPSPPDHSSPPSPTPPPRIHLPPLCSPLPPLDLIPGLPYDLSCLCLARVQGRDFFRLSQVCSSWRALTRCPSFLLLRQQMGAAEEWLALLLGGRHSSSFRLELFNPFLDPLPSFPSLIAQHPFDARFLWGCSAARVGRSVFVFGGASGMDSYQSLDAMWQYDGIRRRWRRAASLLVARSNFAYGVLGRFIVVAGGWGPQRQPLDSVEVYDSESDTWHFVSHMHRRRGACLGIAFEGKLLVISGIDRRSNGGTTTTVTLGCGEMLDVDEARLCKMFDNWQGQECLEQRQLSGESKVQEKEEEPLYVATAHGFGKEGQESSLESRMEEESGMDIQEASGLLEASIGSLYLEPHELTSPTVLIEKQLEGPLASLLELKWTSIEKMWSQVSLPGSLAVLDGQLFCVADIGDSLLEYDWDMNQWHVACPLPYLQKGFQLLPMNGGLLVLGIYGGHWLIPQRRKFNSPKPPLRPQVSWDLGPIHCEVMSCTTFLV